jgi:glucose 1-dehydrogenase/3-dehydrosphinganine reductase
MAACGANVLINYHNSPTEAEALRQSLIKDFGVKAWTFHADLAIEDEIRHMFHYVDEAMGSVDILVNNAGYETIEDAVTMKIEAWDGVLNVNLRGAFICAQEAGKRMVPQKSGVMINISSIHDKVARKGLVHYCCSKAALNMMTKCLALELAEYNIRVLAISPGAIETTMNKEEIARFGREKFDHWIPMGHIGKVDDIAWACAFMASDKAAYFTATELYIDGGYKESTIQYDPRQ